MCLPSHWLIILSSSVSLLILIILSSSVSLLILKISPSDHDIKGKMYKLPINVEIYTTIYVYSVSEICLNRNSLGQTFVFRIDKCLYKVILIKISFIGTLFKVWIYNYLCNQCLSPLNLWVWILLRWGVLDTTLCDKVCQWHAAGQWFSPGTPVFSTNKTDRHDITEILLKVILKTP